MYHITAARKENMQVMKPFMDKDFLLNSDTAKTLYHDYAERMPVLDYHCHINPQEIYEDRVYSNITEVWLGGDHYKWRAIRSNGVDERYITGKDSTDYEKFEKFAEVMPKLIGNPLYHWTHLELQTYFGVTEPLSPKSCRRIWDACNEKLKTLSVRKIIEQSDVRLICTTDDPVDDLKWHKLIAADPTFSVQVLPAFRPDKAMNIDKPGFAAYLENLGNVVGRRLSTVRDVSAALSERVAYFASLGCKASDHGLDEIPNETGVSDLDAVLRQALAGKPVTKKEADAYKTAILTNLAADYKKHGIVMQLHYGAVRNTNPAMFRSLGADTGFDAISGCADNGTALAGLLGILADRGTLPKTVIYSLNPADDAQIGAVIGCFQTPETAGAIQQGSAWWFNDNKSGMTAQLTSLANLGVLGNFIGMLTDSRSFLSYTRHAYFRRILCNLLGGWVENGEYPADLETLGALVQDVSYRNAVRFFGFSL